MDMLKFLIGVCLMGRRWGELLSLSKSFSNTGVVKFDHVIKHKYEEVTYLTSINYNEEDFLNELK